MYIATTSPKANTPSCEITVNSNSGKQSYGFWQSIKTKNVYSFSCTHTLYKQNYNLVMGKAQGVSKLKNHVFE